VAPLDREVNSQKSLNSIEIQGFLFAAKRKKRRFEAKNSTK